MKKALKLTDALALQKINMDKIHCALSDFVASDEEIDDLTLNLLLPTYKLLNKREELDFAHLIRRMNGYLEYRFFSEREFFEIYRSFLVPTFKIYSPDKFLYGDSTDSFALPLLTHAPSREKFLEKLIEVNSLPFTVSIYLTEDFGRDNFNSRLSSFICDVIYADMPISLALDVFSINCGSKQEKLNISIYNSIAPKFSHKDVIST